MSAADCKALLAQRGVFEIKIELGVYKIERVVILSRKINFFFPPFFKRKVIGMPLVTLTHKQ